VLLSSNLPMSPRPLSVERTLPPHGGYPHDRERAPPTRLYRFLLHALVLLMRGPPSSLMHPWPSAESPGKHATGKLGAPRERTATPNSASENRSPVPWCLPPCRHALPLVTGATQGQLCRAAIPERDYYCLSITGARHPGHRGAHTQNGRAIPPGTTRRTTPTCWAQSACRTVRPAVVPGWFPVRLLWAGPVRLEDPHRAPLDADQRDQAQYGACRQGNIGKCRTLRVSR